MLERHFGDVWLGGVDAAPHVKADLAARRVKANKLLGLDVFDLRHRMPHSWYVWSYTRLLPLAYKLVAREDAGRGHGHHGRRLVRHRGARRHDARPLRGGPGPAPGQPGLMLAVGLTGGIGSGKSAVADLLVERGAVLIDADQVARDVVAPGGPAYQPLVDRFGPGILAADGTIDRKALAAVAFADEESRLALNAITHPAIGIAMIEARDALADTDDIVVLAIPLLTAVHRETVKLHKVVVVDCPDGHRARAAAVPARLRPGRRRGAHPGPDLAGGAGQGGRLRPRQLGRPGGPRGRGGQAVGLAARGRGGAAGATPDRSHPPGSLVGSCPNSRSSPPSSPRATSPRPSPALADGVRRGDAYQTLQGITGSGKTATIAWMIEQVQRPTLIIEPNKSLAAQLSSELRELFPKNRVEFFVSYYDYYQPEAYLPTTDTYIEKDSSINDEIDRLRHATTSSLLMRRDVIVVASVSCIYGLGSPDEYRDRILGVTVGEQVDQRDMLRRLVDLQYARNDVNLVRGTFRARGDTVEIHPAYEEQALRVELFGDTVERIVPFDVLTGRDGGGDGGRGRLRRHALRHRRRHHPARRRHHRGGAAGAPPGVREGGQAARGPAPPGAHRARPRDAGRDRRLLGRGELQPPPRRPGTGRDALHAAGLLPQGLPLRDRREPRRRPPAARAVRRRPLPQGRARRARLPAALGQGQPAAALRGVRRAGAPVRLRVGDARAPSSSSTPTRWWSR